MGVKELWAVCISCVVHVSGLIASQVVLLTADKWSLLEFSSNKGFQAPMERDGCMLTMMKVGMDAR